MCIVIWKKRDSSLYYRVVKETYKKYFVGMTNQYGHEVLFIVPKLYPYEKKLPFKTMVKRKLIRFLSSF